jgi:hypothetical protein
MKYALFRKAKEKPEKPHIYGFSTWGKMVFAGDQWKHADTDNKEKPKNTLEFIKMVKHPSEVAEIVRKAPLDQYLLMSGEVAPIQVAMPVMMGGMCLDSMNSEWDETEEGGQA